MIPFRRLWRRVQAPAEPVVSRELAASLGVALAAADRGDDVPPKREPAVHLCYRTFTGPSTACGKYVAVAWLTLDPADVTCGACKRTGLYRKTVATSTDPAVIPAAGTTRKQES